METVNCVLCGSSSYKRIFDAFDLKISKKWFGIVKCDCGLIFTNPRPTKHEISHYYGEKYYSYQEMKIKNNNKLCSTPLKVLDIGCGSGAWLYEQKMQGHDTYGVEISNQASDLANKMGLNVFCGNLEDAAFEDDYFEIIHMNHVLEHVHDPVSVLKEIRRILHPLGKVFIRIPNFDSLESQYYKNSYRELDVPRHLYHFSLDSFSRLVDKCGLTVSKINNLNYPNSISEMKGFTKSQYSTLKLLYYNELNKGGGRFGSIVKGIIQYSISTFRIWSHRILVEDDPGTRSGIGFQLSKAASQ